MNVDVCFSVRCLTLFTSLAVLLFRCFFNAVSNITLRKLAMVEEESSDIAEGEAIIPEGRRSSTGGGHLSALQMSSPAVSATKIDKRLTQIHVSF